MTLRRLLAIDVGGTKLAAALVDPAGEITRRRKVPTSPCEAGSGEQLWATLGDLLDDVCDGLMPDAVGVGCGGPMSWPAGQVSPLNLPAWRDFPLRARLRDRYAGVPVRLVNDAVTMVIGEHWLGAARGFDNVLGVVVSTGVGGGLVLDGRARLGPSGNAGHVGHIVVDPQGPECGCGGRGCLEAIARGPAVVAWAQANGWSPPPETAATGETLLAAAQSGDATAVAAFTRAGEAIGVAVASAVDLLDLDVVVVGGGLSAAGEMLLGPARAAYAAHARMGYTGRCQMVPAALGGGAGLVGAAALVALGDDYWPLGAD